MRAISGKLDSLSEAFKSVLYEFDNRFLKNMKDNNLTGDNAFEYLIWDGSKVLPRHIESLLFGVHGWK